MSEAVASGASPAASAAPEPPEDPPGRELQVPRVPGDSPQRTVRDGRAAVLGSGGAGVDDAAGTPDPVDDRVVLRRELALPGHEPLREGPAPEPVLFLGGHRQAQQRA